MGPYYRGTSHGLGAFFDMFYEHPYLILFLAAGAAYMGYSYWRKKRTEEQSGQ
jgi:hypothetical protein